MYAVAGGAGSKGTGGFTTKIRAAEIATGAGIPVIIMNGEKVNGGRFQDMKKFVRYADGAKMYSMGKTKFQELAKEAQACYKIGQLVLVNTEILDKYLEKYHITDSDFYK